MTESLEVRIENTVRAREVADARKLIRRFLREEKNRFPAVLKSCEWFRRLGLFREAYLLVAPKSWNLTRLAESPERTEPLLWAAYFLDLQGASLYAQKILDRIPLTTLPSLAVAGTIRMSNRSFGEAIDAFEAYFRKTAGDADKLESYAHKMHRISLADSYAGLGRFPDAHRELDSVIPGPDDRFLRGILHQARGEYFALASRPLESLRELDAALTFFPTTERTVDFAFLQKWRGWALSILGKKAEASSAFSEALAVLGKPDHRPEMILDCLYWMDRAGIPRAGEKNLLGAYPGLAPAFVQRTGIRAEGWVGSPEATIRISVERDEWTSRGTHRIGVPLEIALLAYVRRADHLGISVERLKPLLWPDEVASFIQLDARIAKLLQRLREEYEVDLAVESGRIRMTEELARLVTAEFLPKAAPWSFLLPGREFEMAEFAEYYGLGRTVCFKFLGRALEAGWITKRATGKKTLFRVRA